MPAKYPSKPSWANIGGVRKYYRSKMERNYARYLEWLKSRKLIKCWEHEPEVFWFLAIKRGVRSYLPDFRVTNNDDSREYHETKGYMDSQSNTKIKRMAKYYPSVKLILIRQKHINAIDKKIGRLIPGWESPSLIKARVRKAKARRKTLIRST